MDLDHTSLASRPCAVRECKQRDFLPFLCGVCKHTYCSDHRTYKAHECIGEIIKDVHSFECPLCLKTIKYDKISDPNEMFQQHYSSCTQQADKSKLTVNMKKCIECNVKLGLSNAYYCTKCNNNTCLAHRNSDDHKCVVQKRGIAAIAGINNNNSKNNYNKNLSDKQQKLLNNLKGTANNNNNNNNNSSSRASAVKPAAKSVQSDNTLKGSVFRRMEGASKTAPTQTLTQILTQDHKCQYCDFCTYDEVFLSVHMSDAHSTNTSAGAAVSVSSSSSSASSSSSERCPQCQEVFADVGQLIAHFEQKHGNNTPTGSSSGNNISDNCNLN